MRKDVHCLECIGIVNMNLTFFSHPDAHFHGALCVCVHVLKSEVPRDLLVSSETSLSSIRGNIQAITRGCRTLKPSKISGSGETYLSGDDI